MAAVVAPPARDGPIESEPTGMDPAAADGRSTDPANLPFHQFRPQQIASPFDRARTYGTRSSLWNEADGSPGTAWLLVRLNP